MKIGFVSDVHEDIIALKKAFEVLESRGCEEVVCLGDLIGYGVPWYRFLESRSSRDVIALVREKCKTILVGNHDLYAIRKIPEHRARFRYPDDWYELDYAERKKLGDGKVFLYEHEELSPLLNRGDVEFIKGLPEYAVREFNGVKMMLSHYAYPDPTGSTTITPRSWSDARQHVEFMERAGCSIGFSGHNHQSGIALFQANTIRHVPFGKMVIPRDGGLVWIHGPSVARGLPNGVMMFDTETFTVETIPLMTRPQISSGEPTSQPKASEKNNEDEKRLLNAGRTQMWRYGDSVLFSGYQNFLLRKDHIFPAAFDRKLAAKYEALKPLFTQIVEGKSILDLGSNAGFFSFWAALCGARAVTAIDADDVNAETMRTAATVLGIDLRVMKENVESWREEADVVMALSVIYWLAASENYIYDEFADLEKMMERLAGMTREVLIVEWIDQNDATFLFSAGASKKQYGRDQFEAALKRHFASFAVLSTVSSAIGILSDSAPKPITRQIYVARKI